MELLRKFCPESSRDHAKAATSTAGRAGCPISGQVRGSILENGSNSLSPAMATANGAQRVLHLVPTLPSIWLKGVSRRTAMLPQPMSKPTPEIQLFLIPAFSAL